METEQLTELLQQRKDKLLAQIAAIDILLSNGNESLHPTGTATAVAYNGDTNQNSLQEPNAALKVANRQIREKDEETTWKDYLLEVIVKLGNVKVNDLAQIISNANHGKITERRVKDAAGNKLKELVEEKKIGVIAPKSRKAGNTYYPIK